MTHNLISNLMLAGNNDRPTPEVGMGATVCMYSDRHACTIVEVNGRGTRVVVQEDTATRTDRNGLSDAQSYEYTPNPDAARDVFTLRKNGRWVRQGESTTGGTALSIGHRSKFHDFSF